MKLKPYITTLLLFISTTAFSQPGYQVFQGDIELSSASVSKDSRYYQVRSLTLKKGDIFLADVSSKALIPRMVIIKNGVAMQPGMVDFADRTNIKNFYAGQENCIWAVKITEDGQHDLYISTPAVNKGGMVKLSYAVVPPTLLTEASLFPVNGSGELAVSLQKALRHTLINNMQVGVNDSKTNIIDYPGVQLPFRKNYVQNMTSDDIGTPLPDNINVYRSRLYAGCYGDAKKKFDSLKLALTDILPAQQWKGKLMKEKTFFLDPCAVRLDEKANLYFTETYHFYSTGYPQVRRGVQTNFTAKKYTLVAVRLAHYSQTKSAMVEVDVYTADDENHMLSANNFDGISKSK